ncbi:hypothetical protein DM01DRAFT_1385283 [Hesseltinella vesiculosa]|uniref:Zn(2)-C6 fungal-type domain-containing protein n=1 Tax=Hesseltinella vesiculosa TaxID=101127 RepID=A0A1X2GAE8_9FUNG|nr:hypothetical protein DM01DRAFT_1385283 [Hesseltinella vesiculosa]
MKSPNLQPLRPVTILPSNASTSMSPPLVTTTPFKRPRISQACDTCRRRKVRCDMRSQDKECNQCLRSGAHCTFTASRRRGPRGSVAILEERLHRMEQLLTLFGQGTDQPHLTSPPSQPRTPSPQLIHSTRHFGMSHWIYSVLGIDKHTSDELIHFYFTHVYPMFPVVNKTEFLLQYNEQADRYPDPTLLCSIYGSALHHIDCATVLKVLDRSKLPNIASSVANADTWITRHGNYVRKCETPSISVVQSIAISILYHASLEKKWSNVWLLNAAGIRMAQDIGLHRHCLQLTEDQREARSRIWSLLYSVDRWFSAGTGRPCTTFDEDCEQTYTPEMARMHQVNQTLQEYPCSVEPHPKISIFLALAQVVKLSKILGDVIQRLYTPSGKRRCEEQGGAEAVASLEAALYKWRSQLPPVVQSFGSNDDDDLDDSSRMVAYVVGACYFTVLILVHRPFIDKWCHISLRICTAAAVRCVDLMDRLHRLNPLVAHWSFMLYPLFLASLIHIFNASCKDTMIADVARGNLLRALAIFQSYGQLSPLASYLHRILHCAAEKQKHLPTYGISSPLTFTCEDSSIIVDWLHSFQHTFPSTVSDQQDLLGGKLVPQLSTSSASSTSSSISVHTLDTHDFGSSRPTLPSIHQAISLPSPPLYSDFLLYGPHADQHVLQQNTTFAAGNAFWDIPVGLNVHEWPSLLVSK